VLQSHLTPQAAVAATDEIRQLAFEIMDETGAPWDAAHTQAVDELLKLAIDIEDDVRYQPVEVLQ
jgi:hypothetical protein